jgi:hypothetical protein
MDEPKQSEEDLKNKYDNIEKNSAYIKKKMVTLLVEMKKYMLDNNMCGDGFITNLCSDIHVSHKTFGTKFGNMFICARQTSQGTQRGYTVCKTPDLSYDSNSGNTRRFSRAPPKLSRHSNTCKYNDLLQPCEESEAYEVSEIEDDFYNFENAPYLTPTATQIMRSVSENTSDVSKFIFYLSDDDTDNDNNDTNSTSSLFCSP